MPSYTATYKVTIDFENREPITATDSVTFDFEGDLESATKYFDEELIPSLDDLKFLESDDDASEVVCSDFDLITITPT